MLTHVVSVKGLFWYRTGYRKKLSSLFHIFITFGCYICQSLEGNLKNHCTDFDKFNDEIFTWNELMYALQCYEVKIMFLFIFLESMSE